MRDAVLPQTQAIYSAHNKIKGAGSSSEAGQATQNRGKFLYHTARNVHPDVCMEL